MAIFVSSNPAGNRAVGRTLSSEGYDFSSQSGVADNTGISPALHVNLRTGGTPYFLFDFACGTSNEGAAPFAVSKGARAKCRQNPHREMPLIAEMEHIEEVVC